MPQPQTLTPLTPLLLRKSIHFVTGLAIFSLTWVLDQQVLLWLIMGGSVFSFATFRYKRFYLLHQTTDASLGTLFYPIGILSVFLLLLPLPIVYLLIYH